MAQLAQLLTAGLGRMAAPGIMRIGWPMLALMSVPSMNEAQRTGGAGAAPANSPLSAKYRKNFTFVCELEKYVQFFLSDNKEN